MKILLKRLWKNINASRKRNIFLVMLLMLMATVAEIFSIAAIVPFLGIMANPDIVIQHELGQHVIKYLDTTAPDQLLLPFTVVFVLSALLAGFMRIILLWGQTRLAHHIGSDLSYQIYSRTLNQSYSVHVSRNSSEIIAGISTKADQVVAQVILPIMYIISSVFMLTMILITLIAIYPAMAISTMVGFTIIYVFFIGLTKKRLYRNSKKISNNTNLTIKLLQEGLGGIRDVLIDGTQRIYCSAFRVADVKRRRAIANNQIIGQSPRYGVESLGMVLIACLAYFLNNEDSGINSALPMLGALAIAAQRLLPMLQQSYVSWSKIQGSQVILQDTLLLLEQSPSEFVQDNSNDGIAFQKFIQLDSISFRYKQDASWVLKNLSLTIPKGARVGFIGLTGSGKSTLLDIIMALLHPTKGGLKVDDVEVHSGSYRGWQANIAHIPQTIYLADTTITENIAFGLPKNQIDYARVVSAAKKAQIDETVQSLDKKYETLVGERGVRLSGGQRQRIGIARALYKHANVLILDEATSALDNQTEKEVINAIDNIGKDITVLTVAHRLSTLENCDLIVELENGSIKRQGTPSEILGL